MPSSGLRLRSTAAEPKVTRDIGYSVVDELERLEALPWYRSLPLRLGGVFSDSLERRIRAFLCSVTDNSQGRA